MQEYKYFMKEALELAKVAYSKGEVPIGAVVVVDNEIVGRGYNQVEEFCDPTAHAEIMAIKEACSARTNWRLEDAVLVTTVEPCLMCAGAILTSRIKKVVFATKQARFGAFGSLLDVSTLVLNESQTHSESKPALPISSNKIEYREGLCASEARELLRSFFSERRGKGILK
jgi:tRNA(adenine34) deaminase